MPVLLRVTMILTFIVSLAAGMSAGKIYAQYGYEYGDQPSDSAGRTFIKTETAAVRSAFPESEDMLRQMANEMMKSQSLQEIEPASGSVDQ